MLILDLETSCRSQGLANILGVVGGLFVIIEILAPIILIASLIKHFSVAMANPDDERFEDLSTIKPAPSDYITLQ